MLTQPPLALGARSEPLLLSAGLWAAGATSGGHLWPSLGNCQPLAPGALGLVTRMCGYTEAPARGVVGAHHSAVESEAVRRPSHTDWALLFSPV